MTNNNNSLPLIELRIDENDDSIVDTISIVSHPAIDSNFLAFNDDSKQIKFEFNDEKRELIGAALIPDIKIFRVSEGGNFFCYFSKETIRTIAQVFFKKGFSNNMNVEHSEVNAESFVFQSYIVDSELGLTAPKGIDVPNGTWIVGVKVNSDSLWKDIKSGKRAGFSIEGLFKMIDTKRNVEMGIHEDDISDEEFNTGIKAYTELLERYKNQI